MKIIRKITLIVVLSFLFFSTESFRYDLSKSAIKKMDKTLAKLWPGETIIKKPIHLTPTVQNKISFKLENNSLYSILINGKTDAYISLSKGKGKMNYFDYMIVFKKDISILKIKVLVYREEYGGEIGSGRWLKQFTGKKNPEKMKFGYDIQNISGATISARSLTEDVKKVTKKMIELKNKGII